MFQITVVPPPPEPQIVAKFDLGIVELGKGPPRDDIRRVRISGDNSVSRDHVWLCVDELGHCHLKNLSTRNRIIVDRKAAVPPGEEYEFDLDEEQSVRLRLGNTYAHLRMIQHSDGNDLQTIALPVRLSHLTQGRGETGLSNLLRTDRVTELFEAISEIQRIAAMSDGFFAITAETFRRLVNLDGVVILLRENDQWQMVASEGNSESDTPYSTSVLQRLLKAPRTYFRSYSPAGVSLDAASLTGIESVVVSPILDDQGRVIGALYGTRLNETTTARSPISELEAKVAQLLATAIGNGLARQKMEREASRMRGQFEQFFGRTLAEELERNPDLLSGQERELTVLFSDIRGFSHFSERLKSPKASCDLVGEVMELLTKSIRDHDGVIVDYMGDGLVAMWNAPTSQPEHATLACRAALASQAQLPGLSAKWEDRLGAPLQVGIGINTGPALVGNTGTQFKFKYGPLGHTVNVASRIEGATKYFRVPILLSGATWQRVREGFSARRICNAILKGIKEPIELHELHAELAAPAANPASTQEWTKMSLNYEKALYHFEAREFVECCQAIYPLLAGRNGIYDIAALDLSTRALEYLKDPEAIEEFESVFRLDKQ